MRIKVVTLTILAILIIGVVSAQADVFKFEPNPKNLWNLSHGEYMCWGIDWNVPDGQFIVDAVLYIDKIQNDSSDPKDRLYIHLLDNTPAGTNRWNDGFYSGDNWADKNKNVPKLTGPIIAVYRDLTPRPENLSYSFAELGLLDTLNEYLSTAPGRGKVNFGIGFDPDCHYTNCGVRLEIETSCVPEPSSILGLLGGLGSAVAVVARRRFF